MRITNGFEFFWHSILLAVGGDSCYNEIDNGLERGSSPQFFQLFFQVDVSALFNHDYVVASRFFTFLFYLYRTTLILIRWAANLFEGKVLMGNDMTLIFIFLITFWIFPVLLGVFGYLAKADREGKRRPAGIAYWWFLPIATPILNR